MFKAREKTDKDDIITSMKSSLTNAENLLREAATDTGDSAADLRERALASLRHARESLCDAQNAVYERSRRAARITDDYVHDNPWQAIGVAGMIGLLLGVLIGRP